jgi:hypothetical protein
MITMPDNLLVVLPTHQGDGGKFYEHEDNERAYDDGGYVCFYLPRGYMTHLVLANR